MIAYVNEFRYVCYVRAKVDNTDVGVIQMPLDDYALQYTEIIAYRTGRHPDIEDWDIHGRRSKIISLAPTKINAFNQCITLLHC
jgi:hypothetical protein